MWVGQGEEWMWVGQGEEWMWVEQGEEWMWVRSGLRAGRHFQQVFCLLAGGQAGAGGWVDGLALLSP